MPSQPKPAFYFAVALVVVALIAFAVYRGWNLIAPAGNVGQAAGGNGGANRSQ